ncbi:MAG: Ig-like domain-containing protein [Clostridia bacterium]|nr:Ig-like domain-containing protein [Clostridia bacterium]
MKTKNFFALIAAFVLSACLLVPVFGASEVGLNRKKAVLVVGQSYQLSLTGTKKVPTWKTSDKKIVAVGKSGTVKGISKGTATVTATLGKSVFKCKITVEAPKISIEKISVGIGRSFTLKLNGTARTPKWQSSDKKIATVDKNGVVKPLSKGNVLISAVLGGKKYSCKVTVTRAIKLTSSEKEPTVYNSKTLVITYTGKGSLYYHISDPDVISLKWDKYWDGDKIKLYVTVKKSGKAQIKLTNDFNDEIRKINVNAFKVDAIILSKSFVTLYSEDECKNFNHTKLKATVISDAKNVKVTWSTSDRFVAKVSQNGNVVAVDEGEATITASCGNIKATCEVEARLHPLDGIRIDTNYTSGKAYYLSFNVLNHSEKDIRFSPYAELSYDEKHDPYKLVSYNPGQGLETGFNWLAPKGNYSKCTYVDPGEDKITIISGSVLTVIATHGNEDYLIKIGHHGYSYTPYGESIPKNEQFFYYVEH